MNETMLGYPLAYESRQNHICLGSFTSITEWKASAGGYASGWRLRKKDAAIDLMLIVVAEDGEPK